MDILNQFGVQPILLTAQVVNFLILLFILKRFLYGPILKVLNDRKKRIEESLRNAEEIEKRLAEISLREEQQIQRGVKVGEKIIADAGTQAAQIVEDGRNKAEAIIISATKQAQEIVALERENLSRRVRESLSEMVALVVGKVTGKAVTKEDQKRIIEQEIKHLS